MKRNLTYQFIRDAESRIGKPELVTAVLLDKYCFEAVMATRINQYPVTVISSFFDKIAQKNWPVSLI